MSCRLLPGWLALLFFLGCHFTEGKAPAPRAVPEEAPAPGRQPAAATTVDAHGEPAPPGKPAANDLAVAAIFLEKGDQVGACFHLGRFVQQHPEHANARCYWAELLCKLGKRPEARVQFERAAADAQESRPVDVHQQLHMHSRLLEIAEAEDDDYRAHLHRGIGLWLLAQGRGKLDDPEGDLPVEGLLCKAAGELTMAHGLKPTEARPSWYLFMVWRQLAQPQQARKWLTRAQDAASFYPLTPAEQRGLHLAAAASASRLHP